MARVATAITAIYAAGWILVSFVSTGTLPVAAKIGNTLAILTLPLGHLVGWWMLTSSLPGQEDNAVISLLRVPLRGLLVITTAAFVVPTAFVLWTGDAPSWLTLTLLLVWTILLTLTCAAQMMYIRWLADILGDQTLRQIVGLFLGLGPFLLVTGVLSAGLGPLVVLIAYWGIFTRARKDLLGLSG